MLSKPIIINEWARGITSSPFEGISDMRNMEISDTPGVIQLAFRLQQFSPTPVSTTFTADDTTDILTSLTSFRWSNHGATGRAVTFTTTGTLPAPLAAGTTYFLIDETNLTFKVATTLAGAEAGTAINITDTGTGVHTITSVNMRTPMCYAYDPRGDKVYLLDSIGQVWEGDMVSSFYLITGNTLTNGFGNGIAVWKNYLFVYRDSKIDVWGSLLVGKASRTWTNDWQTLNQTSGGTATHVTQIMSNQIQYFADRNVSTGTPYVGSIDEVAGQVFAPGTPATYTFNNQALDLPKYDYINDFDQYYGNLMIATEDVEIYPWDTISDSFDDPIISPETGVNQIATVNNLLYFVVNKTGNIYATQGTANVQLVVSLPQYLTKTDRSNVTVDYMIPYINGLLFTMRADNTTTAPINSVWYYDFNLQSLIVKNSYSTGSYTTTEPGALFTNGGAPYLAGWHISTTSFGLDGLVEGATFQRETGYLGYVESALYQIGTSLYPTNLSRISFELAKPLTTGQGVKLEKRQNLTDAYTTIGTYDFATYGAIQTIDDFPNIIDAQVVQIKASLTAPSGSSGSSVLDSPELMNVTLQ